MKFTVRDGFFLQFSSIQEDGQGGKMAVPAFFPGGKTVDLPEDIAAANLHMLEPADKAATAFCEARHVANAPTGEGSADVAAVAAAAAKAVIDGLVAAGVIKAAAPAA